MMTAEGTGRPSILIADDSYANRALLRKILSQDYEIAEAENGVQALAYLCAHRETALVLLDIQMPELDGFGVLDAVRGDPALSDIPIVVDTANDDIETQIKALDRGATDVLVKPFNHLAVIHRVRNILARRESMLMSARNAMLEELLHQSEIDEKTGLYNKHAFCRKAAALLRAHPEVPFLILRGDIDRFKVLNDVFGIAAGDAFLKHLGEIVGRWSGELVVCGHWEADHFVLCLPAADFPAQSAAERFSRLVADVHLDFEFVTRIGVYKVTDPEVDVALMCDRALLALRSIKGSYTERVAYYDESMRAALLEEQEIIGEMDRALQQGQFVVYLQPQVNYPSRTIRGAEALVRWQHPQKGLVPPYKFIPVFEQSGFISHLDEYVWEETCRLLRRWLDAGLQVPPVSVNISRRDIYNPKLCQVIRDLTEKYGLPTSLLHLEITESAYMENAEQLIRTVNALREAGFSVEMDDFGSGYSSLNTLKAVPVDLLKLDMKFLEDSAGDTKGGSILTSIIRMAHWIKLPVIAEGVETREQAEYLKSVGCQYMQGYYFARPMPAEEYEKLLRTGIIDSGRDDRFSDGGDQAEDFLSDSTQATLLFNSFVGGAAIVEYCEGHLEALRLNDKYFEVVGTTREAYAAQQTHLLDRFDAENGALLTAAIEQAIETREECGCELCSLPLEDGGGALWMSVHMRALARNGNRHILYLSLEDITPRVRLSEKLTAIMDSVPGGILDFEVGERIHTVYFNDMVPAMFGYSRESYHRSFSDAPLTALHPDDLPALQARIERCLSGDERTLEQEYRHLCADGSWRHVRLTARIVRRKDELVYATGILLDIEREVAAERTADRQAAELERQRASLQALYDSIPCGVMQFALAAGPDGMNGLLSLNDTAWKIYGYESRSQYVEATRGNSKMRNIHPEDLPEVRRCIELLRSSPTGTRVDCDHRVVQPNGGVRWVHALFQTVRYAGGEEVVQVVFSDVTDRKQVDLEHLSCALFALYDEVFEFDLEQDTSYMRAAPTAVDPRIGRYVPLSRLLDVWAEHVLPEDRPRFRAFFAEVGKEPQTAPTVLEFRYLGAEKEVRWASATVIHLRGSTYLTCNRDITDRRKAGELAAQNESLRTLIREREQEAERNRLFVEYTGMMIYDYDPAADTLTLQRPAEDGGVATEVAEGYFAGLAEDPAIHPEDRARVRDMIAALRQGPGQQTVEYRCARFGSGYIPCRAQAVSITDEAGRVIRAIGMLSRADEQAAAPRRAQADRSDPEGGEASAELERFSRTLLPLFDEIMDLDFDRDLLSVLSAMCRGSLTQRPLAQALERWTASFICEEDRAAYRAFMDPARIREAFRRGESPALEYAIHNRDGSLRRCRSTLLRLGAGRYLCCNKDITQQQQDEQLREEMVRLRASTEAQNRYQLVVEQTGTAVIEMNYETGTLSASPAYSRYEGSRHSQEEMFANKGDRSLVHPDDQPLLERFFADSKDGRKYAETVLRLKMTDGSYRYTRMTGSYLFAQDGTLRRSIGTFTDVDNETRAQQALESLSARMNQIVASIPAGIAIYEVGETVCPVFVSDRTCELFGVTREEYDLRIANQQPIGFMPSAEHIAALRGGKPLTVPRIPVRKQDGGRFWLRAFCRMESGPNGADLCYAVLSDISEEVALEQKNAWQTEKNRILTESSDMISFDYAPREDVMRMSIPRPGQGMMEDVHERYLATFKDYGRIPDREKDRFLEAVRAACARATTGSYDFEGDYFGTGPRWYRAKFVSLADESGQVYRMVGWLDDISDIMREQDQLRAEVRMDDLTGVYNKGYAAAEIERILREKPTERVDGLLFMDIDNFKEINDTVGHLEADQVLKKLGAVLRSLFRKEDLVARFGGDEFLMYMKDAGTRETATDRAEAILREVGRITLSNGSPIHCSIGIAGVMGENVTYDGIVKRADMALYAAKENGKNQYAVLEQPARELMQLL